MEGLSVHGAAAACNKELCAYSSVYNTQYLLKLKTRKFYFYLNDYNYWAGSVQCLLSVTKKIKVNAFMLWIL